MVQRLLRDSNNCLLQFAVNSEVALYVRSPVMRLESTINSLSLTPERSRTFFSNKVIAAQSLFSPGRWCACVCVHAGTCKCVHLYILYNLQIEYIHECRYCIVEWLYMKTYAKLAELRTEGTSPPTADFSPPLIKCLRNLPWGSGAVRGDSSSTHLVHSSGYQRLGRGGPGGVTRQQHRDCEIGGRE